MFPCSFCYKQQVKISNAKISHNCFFFNQILKRLWEAWLIILDLTPAVALCRFRALCFVLLWVIYDLLISKCPKNSLCLTKQQKSYISPTLSTRHPAEVSYIFIKICKLATKEAVASLDIPTISLLHFCLHQHQGKNVCLSHKDYVWLLNQTTWQTPGIVSLFVSFLLLFRFFTYPPSQTLSPRSG